MTNTTHQDETEQLLAFLTRTENDETIDPSLTSSSNSSSSTPTTTNPSIRPLNFSSAFSQSSSSRPRRSSALTASHNITQSFLPQSIEDFQNFDDFLPQPPPPTIGGEEILAGPGPNSIAAAVARNGIQGLEQFEPPSTAESELPIPPPSFIPSQQQQKQSVTSQIVEGKKKRGRPRTKAVKDPSQPPKKRGRPRKDQPIPDVAPPAPEQPPLLPPAEQPASNEADPDSLILFEEEEEESQSGGEASEGEYESSNSSSREGDPTATQGKERKRKKKKKGRKLIEPPLIPRVFRKMRRKSVIDEKELEVEVADLDVHDLMEGRTSEEDKQGVGGLEEEELLTEEQKRELQRALNPQFTTRLLTTLEEHSQQYARAYKALQEELLAVQIEESLLEHVKEVALEMRNNIRYPLKTMEEIQQLEPTSRS
ncbi:hypothetical protein JCM5350_003890 [Sporobolomyces pararoseus]